MDWTVGLGFILAFGGILVANTMDGGSTAGLVNVSAAVLILCGTLGATLVSCGPLVWRGVLPVLGRLVGPMPGPPEDLVEKFGAWAQIARRDGVLALEGAVREERDPYLLEGVRAVIDGYDRDAVEHLLEVRAHVEGRQLREAARVFETAGGFAPTIGIIGTVLGLTHVLKDLSDVERIGIGIATAFMATFYGVATANLVWLPLANKARVLAGALAVRHAAVRDGVLALLQGDTPTVVRQKILVHLGGAKQVKERAAGAEARADA